jgi:redox-sensing transcriptional repressor
MVNISATFLATDLQLNPIQVRKDIALTGIEGKPKIGFSVNALIISLTNALGWNNTSDAILIGAGNLGKALLGYEGFSSYGLRIVGAFDKDPQKIGTEASGLVIRPLEELEAYVIDNRINIAIIAVPARQAQTVATLLVKCGVIALWNFAPVHLQLPDGIVVQRTDLASHFAALSEKMRRALDEKEVGVRKRW